MFMQKTKIQLETESKNFFFHIQTVQTHTGKRQNRMSQTAFALKVGVFFLDERSKMCSNANFVQLIKGHPGGESATKAARKRLRDRTVFGVLEKGGQFVQ